MLQAAVERRFHTQFTHNIPDSNLPFIDPWEASGKQQIALPHEQHIGSFGALMTHSMLQK